MTGVSQSTMGRLLRELENRNWIRRVGPYHEATEPGAFVALGIRELVARVETERELRDVWPFLPGEGCGFEMEMCADAVVTVATPDDPYRPVNRFVSLLEDTDRLRFAGFDVSLLAPCADEFRRALEAGVEAELIEPSGTAAPIVECYPEQSVGTLADGTLSVWMHDDLPTYGVGLFDARVAISGCHPDSGAVAVLVDTGNPGARAWAVSLYESYRREAATFDRGQTA